MCNFYSDVYCAMKHGKEADALLHQPERNVKENCCLKWIAFL